MKPFLIKSTKSQQWKLKSGLNYWAMYRYNETKEKVMFMSLYRHIDNRHHRWCVSCSIDPAQKENKYTKTVSSRYCTLPAPHMCHTLEKFLFGETMHMRWAGIGPEYDPPGSNDPSWMITPLTHRVYGWWYRPLQAVSLNILCLLKRYASIFIMMYF